MSNFEFHYLLNLNKNKASDIVNFFEEKWPDALKKVEQNLLTGKMQVYLKMDKSRFHSLVMYTRLKFGRRAIASFAGFDDEQWITNKDIRFCANT
jgi:hypothetical protein